MKFLLITAAMIFSSAAFAQTSCHATYGSWFRSGYVSLTTQGETFRYTCVRTSSTEKRDRYRCTSLSNLAGFNLRATATLEGYKNAEGEIYNQKFYFKRGRNGSKYCTSTF